MSVLVGRVFWGRWQTVNTRARTCIYTHTPRSNTHAHIYVLARVHMLLYTMYIKIRTGIYSTYVHAGSRDAGPLEKIIFLQTLG